MPLCRRPARAWTSPPNRPDLLCHKGIARELSASFRLRSACPPFPGQRARRPAVAPQPPRAAVVGGITVTIEDPEACRRFHGALIRGAKVGPSPAVAAPPARGGRLALDQQRRGRDQLRHARAGPADARLRPRHAPRGRGSSSAARRPASGSSRSTASSATLDADMIVIADAEGVDRHRPASWAARAPRSATETRDILLEGAWLDPSRIRRARRALGMSTEASYRFERGIDRWGGADAMRRCIEIILATAGGELAEAPLDLLARAVAPAAHLPPPGAGGAGARRRASLGRDRAVPRRHRRHGRVQTRRRPHRRGRARLAARPGRARST